MTTLSQVLAPRQRWSRAPLAALLLGVAHAAALFGSGCTPTTPVMPAAHVAGVSPDGRYSATTYVLEQGARRIGTAQLWSRGPERAEVDGEARTVVHVGFAFDNEGDMPLHFEEGRLRLVDVSAGPSSRNSVPTLRVDGDRLIPPGQKRDIHAHFVLPPRAWPDDVQAYRVEWALEGDSSLVQRTAFVSSSAQRRPYAIYHDGHYWPHAPYGAWGSSPASRFGAGETRDSTKDDAPQRIYIRSRER